MQILESKGRTFRAEKVPLCYMRWYEHISTETRKIVKNEERIVHFLEFREFHKDKGHSFEHEYKKWCDNCDLKPVCAWIPEWNTIYKYVKEKPQKITKEEMISIINKIKSWNH
jgi:hypothetical protein